VSIAVLAATAVAGSIDAAARPSPMAKSLKVAEDH
jgi:hypothetical protein